MYIICEGFRSQHISLFLIPMSHSTEKPGKSSASLEDIPRTTSNLDPVPMHDVQIAPNWWWKYRYAHIVVVADVN